MGSHFIYNIDKFLKQSDIYTLSRLMNFASKIKSIENYKSNLLWVFRNVTENFQTQAQTDEQYFEQQFTSSGFDSNFIRSMFNKLTPISVPSPLPFADSAPKNTREVDQACAPKCHNQFG